MILWRSDLEIIIFVKYYSLCLILSISCILRIHWEFMIIQHVHRNWTADIWIWTYPSYLAHKCVFLILSRLTLFTFRKLKDTKQEEKDTRMINLRRKSELRHTSCSLSGSSEHRICPKVFHWNELGIHLWRKVCSQGAIRRGNVLLYCFQQLHRGLPWIDRRIRRRRTSNLFLFRCGCSAILATILPPRVENLCVAS